MELIVFVSVYGADEVEIARRIARECGIVVPDQKKGDEAWKTASRILSAFHLDLDREMADRYMAELSHNNIRAGVNYKACYSRDDILQAPFVDVSVSMDRQYVEVDRDLRYGGAVGGCEQCKSLATLVGPLVFDGAPEPDLNITRTSTGDWLVSRRLADVLRTVPGVAQQLVPLRNAGHWAGWEHLLVESNMPSFDPSTSGYVAERQCPICTRDGFGVVNRFGVPVLRYRRSDLDSAGPINGSYELIGRSVVEDGRILSLANPMLLVKPDVARIVLDETHGDVQLEPVELV